MKKANTNPEEPTLVFETNKPFEAEIIKGLLEDHDIPSHIITNGRERNILLPIFNIFNTPPINNYRIYVNKEHEAKALEILNSPIESHNGGD